MPTRRTRPSSLRQEPEALAWARQKAGLTKRALAEMIGVSEQLMGEMESGWRSATPTNLLKIAKALNCPVAMLERNHAAALVSGQEVPLTMTTRTGRPLPGALHRPDVEPYITRWEDEPAPDPPTVVQSRTRVLPRSVVPLMAGRQEDGTADVTVAYDARLRDLEAEAFRTGCILAGHSEQLTTIREQQHTVSGTIDTLAKAIGTPGEHTIAEGLGTIGQRLGIIEQRLGTIEHVLYALARAQDIDPAG